MPDDLEHTRNPPPPHPASIFDLEIAFVSFVFGVVALAAILAKLHIQIPGTEIVTDPREIFVLLGAAITGPIGGIVVGLLASLGDPNPQHIPYIAANHILGAVWVGWAYRRLVFERLRMPALAVGWFGIVCSYYFLSPIPVVAFTRAALPSYFLTIVPNEGSLWETLSLMYSGWTMEFVLTSVVTTTALAALPGNLRKPLWGLPRGLAAIPPDSRERKAYRLLGFRLTVWFILLSLLPLVIIAIFLRTNLTRAFIDQVAQHDREIVRSLAADPRLAQDPAALADMVRDLPVEVHTSFLLDGLGHYAAHVDSARRGRDARADFFPTMINRILQQREGYYVDDLGQQAFVFSPLNGTPLTAVVVTSTRGPLAALREVENSSLIRLSAALLVLSGIAGTVIWLLVGRPLRTLADAAQRIGRGDLDARVDTRFMEDEVAQLGFAFNDMVRDLSTLNRGLQEEIRQHQATVEALRESEAKFREMTDLLPQPIYEADMRGSVTFANKAALAVFGYTSDALAKSPPVTDMVAPEDRARVLQAIPEIFSRAGATGTEYMMLRSDGTRFPALLYTAPILRDATPAGIRGIVLDISERKRQEELVAERADASIRRQKALLELAQATETGYRERVRKITETASHVLGAGRVSVWRFIDNHAAIECEDLFLSDTGEHTAGPVLRKDDSPRYFEALTRFRSVDAHDARTDERTSEFRDSYLIPHGITSMLDSVIWRGGVRMGVVCVEHVGPARVWTAEEIQFAASIADQVSLAFETAERKRVQETLFDSEAKFRTIIEQLADGFVLIDADGTIIECNHAHETISGMSRDRILGEKVWTATTAATPPQSRSEATTRKLKAAVLSAITDAGSPIFGSPREFAYVRPDGTEGFLQQVLFPIRFTDGNRIGAVSRDVTERRRTEEKVRASLAEKELMLKEIHHRVKNNLQVISSLLSLQSGSVRDPQDLALFRESEDRIRSMALIHEKLYQSSDFSRVDFRQYLESLVGYLFRSYRVADVRYEMEIDDIHLGINAAIPCGLVLNELLTNALKHAFPAGRSGRILLGLRRLEVDRARLTVRDNGIGLPAGFDPEKAQSLGMHLIKILAKQLDGALSYRNDDGAVFEVVFPIDPGVTLTSSRPRGS